MEILFCPWRRDYLVNLEQRKKSVYTDSCVFCDQVAANDDRKHFILARYEHCFVMLNLYPYSVGHLLVLPYQHTAMMMDISRQARDEMSEVVARSSQILMQQFNAHGINIGTNLGKAAGAGLPEHLHTHVLTRWLGDTNFLPIIAGAKQVSFELHGVYDVLQPLFSQLTI